MEPIELIEVLETSELFGGLAGPDVERIAFMCTVEERRAGECVFRQGTMGEDLYIIADGLVVLQRAIDLGTKTGTASIANLGKGRALGCWSILIDGPRVLMSTAVCQKPTTLVKLPGEQLRKMMAENKEFGFQLMKSLCFLLRERILGAYGAMERL
jgi:CRP-like cAMP-binding protein